MTGRVCPLETAYPDDGALRSYTSRALERIRALPGVEAAGVSSFLPFGWDGSSSVIIPEGYVMAPGESVVSPNQLLRDRRVPGSAARPAEAGAVLHRERRATRAARRHRRRAAGQAGSGRTPIRSAGACTCRRAPRTSSSRAPRPSGCSVVGVVGAVKLQRPRRGGGRARRRVLPAVRAGPVRAASGSPSASGAPRTRRASRPPSSARSPRSIPS